MTPRDFHIGMLGLTQIERITIAILTHRGSAFERMRGLMAGCNRYLAKPIAVQTLNKVLHELIPAQMLAVATAPQDASRMFTAFTGDEP